MRIIANALDQRQNYNKVYSNNKITTQHKSYGSDFGADKKEFYKEINKGIYKIDETFENIGEVTDNNKAIFGFDYSLLNEFDRVMKKINIYIWCSKKQLIPLVYHYVIQKKCNWNIINWCKTNPIPTCNNSYLTDVEYCLFFRDKGVRVYGSYDTKHTYYVTPINQKDKKIWKHPTIKPEFIIDNFIINSSNENDTILDPFMGSGTTGACCKRLNRDFIGIEINKEYYDIAVDRINNKDSEQAKNDTEELEGQIKLTD